jgi:hypothetical protein
MFKNFRSLYILPLALLLAIGVYYLPPVHSRLSWRLDNLRTRVVYFFKPPDQAVFRPEQQADFESILATTRAQYAQTLTPEAMATSAGTSTPEAGPTPVPTITPTPLSWTASNTKTNTTVGTIAALPTSPWPSPFGAGRVTAT